MIRREFIALAGGAVAWPVAVRAQQPERMRRIGVLVGLPEDDPDTKARLTGFRQVLERLGWSEGRNVRTDYRFAPAGTQAQVLAKELVALHPEVIVAQTTPVVAALLRETRTIPIVFVGIADPIGSGFVASLARPGGSITGMLLFEASITGKWLAMLKEIAPDLARAALVVNPKTAPYYDYFLRATEAAAPSLVIELVLSPVADTAADIERAIEAFARVPNGGLLLPPDSTTVVHRDHIIARGPASLARGLLGPSLRRGRWAHVLHHRPRRPVSVGSVLCRSHLARHQACRPSGACADQIPNGPQPQNGEDDRPDCAAGPARVRRRLSNEHGFDGTRPPAHQMPSPPPHALPFRMASAASEGI
jgi:putative ABC transport system substrate-binding protein